MARQTQYIGLNKFAIELTRTALKVEEYKMTFGMFQEEVTGRIFHMTPPKGPNKALIYKEVVQATPWSSGPMIFTALQQTLVKECGQELVEKDLYCAWIIDPSLEGKEYDYETGRMYV